MGRLLISLLGTFRVRLDGQPVSGFLSNKVRALLAYLSVEADRPHQRIHLAGLLWPDWPEPTGRTYLRQSLANLRHLLGDGDAPVPFLLATRQSIQFNTESDHRLDVAELNRALAQLPMVDRLDSAAVERLQTAVALYRGSFLEGFFVDGCPAFEEWQLLTRERLQRETVETLDFLVRWHEKRGAHGPALQYARQRSELEPLAEEGERQLLQLLTLSGERGMALAHYEGYCRLLAEELGIVPSAKTIALVEQIRAGHLSDPQSRQQDETRSRPARQGHDTTAPLPPFLIQPLAPRTPFPFVAREQELAQLHAHLRGALARQGRVVFVIGEAGQGKTLLIREFARQAQDAHPHLVVAGGGCTSYQGIGDPFLPFREILAQLSGDFEAPWAAGELTPDQARRLWTMIPHTVEALLTQGPDLIDTLVPGAALAARLAMLPAGEMYREQVNARRSALPTPQQSALLEQCTKVLQALARERPLLLWLDDLHWADLSSIALLFHLGQRLAGNRILIVGAYRPEELNLGRAGQRHPLERVVHEIQQHVGPITVGLSRSQNRAFVDAYLDTEPNHLGSTFRETLYQLSGGHALFTVELVHTMQERGALVRDREGYWIAGPDLRWETLPARVEAAIAERMNRLPAELHSALAVASVQGEQFTAEVVADVLGDEAHALTRRLSDELERRYRLVEAQGIQRIGEQRLAHYRFRHGLFQKYIYEGLNAVERAQLHELVARALETCYRAQPDQLAAVAGQLAWHYAKAEMPTKAIFYLSRAGYQAAHLAAHDEALDYFQQGLALLDRLPNTPAQTQFELDLLMGLGSVQAMVKGNASTDVEDTFTRARRLCRQLQDPPQRVQVLLNLWHLRFQRGEYNSAQELAQECLQIAERAQEPALLTGAHTTLGSTLYRLGQMVEAQDHLAEARHIYDARQKRRPVYLYGFHPSVNCRANESLVLWYLGYPDQARRRQAEALATAQTCGHAPSITFATVFGAGLFQRAHMPQETATFAAQALRLSREHDFALWSGVSTLYHGWTLVAQGHVEEGLAQARHGLLSIQGTGMAHVRYAAVLADAYHTAGEVYDSLVLVEELLALIDRCEEREWEAELHRLRGELLQILNQVDEAEACFRRAIDVASRQQARSLELRATTSLGRLWQVQGRTAEAQDWLSAIYDWFSEGFDTPDLMEAKGLLDELARTASRGGAWH